MKILTASLALGMVLSASLAGSAAALTRTTLTQRLAPLPPIGCPPGWQLATPPLNPQLGCIPNQIQAPEQPQPAPTRLQVSPQQIQLLPTPNRQVL